MRLILAAIAAFFVLAISASAAPVTGTLSIVEAPPYVAGQEIHAIATMSGQNGQPSVRLICVKDGQEVSWAELGIKFLHVGFDLRVAGSDCELVLGYYREPRHVKYVVVQVLAFHVES